MKGLAPTFHPPESYEAAGGYKLLPLRFLALDETRCVVSGMGGDFAVMSREELVALVGHRFPKGSRYDDLKGLHLIADGDDDAYRDLLAAKVRTRLSRLPDFTSLHLFVVTLRCDHSCQYCQVSRVSEDREAFDMTEETAERAIDLMLQSPSPELKVEFQGGEPLLNFPLIEYVVKEVNRRAAGRDVGFVITSNLANLTDEMLEFAVQHRIHFSTSLDGPEELHNANRPRPGRNSWAKAIAGIRRVRERLGENGVAALMTTTARALDQPEAIIDEYVRQGFRSIFLRHISPYGFAVKAERVLGYQTEKFLKFYKRGLAHILALNRNGVPIVEIYTQLMLQRLLRPFPTGYVDLQSPTGAGLAAVVYNYNGGVYAADEGRMLAEMGDETFRLGDVGDSYTDLFLGDKLLSLAFDTMAEGTVHCDRCGLLPYCGTDPVFHHRTQGDAVGRRPDSAFCRRNMEVLRHIIKLLEDDLDAARILKSWT
jgi:uncharacterized protein